jgi:molybdopterin converting factor small subunit
MTPPIEYCGDTPLSMTASLLGILAYASALFAGLLVFFASLRNATSEIRHRLEDFDSSLSQFDALTERLRNYEAEGRDVEYLNGLVRRTARQIQNTIRTLQDMGLMTGSFDFRERGRVEYDRVTKWKVGGRFVFRQDEVADKLKRTQTMLAETQVGVRHLCVYPSPLFDAFNQPLWITVSKISCEAI